MQRERNKNKIAQGLWARGHLVRLLFCALGFAPLAGPASAEFIYGDARVVDGDTLVVDDMTIRLFGIDAPEGRQVCAAAGGSTWDCGAAAADRLRELAGLGPVACDGNELDDYGRTLAVCDAYDGTPINATLVSEGLAWAFVRYSGQFVVEEAQARSAGLGVWQAPTQPPWEYRAELATSPEPAGGCLIKGNINRNGDRIYHRPTDPTYDDVVIRVEDGERWFCTEQAAIDAGWRAAR
jgi:endonuclease YncB( thermonuclease family)